jgi:glycosyltransferase involved in cell wall biosynthesis
VSDRYRIFVPHASETFTNYRPHGDGLVAFEVASRLAARGHEVHVMATTMDLTGSLPATLHLHPLSKPVHMGARGILDYLPQVRATYARLRRTGPFDLIHQLNPVHAGISLALFGTRVPVVLGAYVSPWPPGADSPSIMGAAEGPVAAFLRRAVTAVQQRLASAIVVTTPAARAQIVVPALERAKVFEIPHGIDPGLYDRGAAEPEEGAEPTIVFLGGTERRKGIYELLEAFKVVLRACPEARLLIAGAGGREGQIAALVETMDERSSISLLGVVERADVPQLMHRATVFAAPSYGEPFGMALLEAMASGIPVVVTDAGGAAHIVDSAGGIKVPVADAAALAAALIEILRSPQRAQAMGRYNRQKTESVYAWDRVIDRIEAMYARVLAGRRT